MTRDIRATRDRLGLSTAELARLVGVSYRAAHHWMEGKAVPEPVWRLLELMDAKRIEGVAGQLYGYDLGKTDSPRIAAWPFISTSLADAYREEATRITLTGKIEAPP